jgi:hypothetical protein
MPRKVKQKQKQTQRQSVVVNIHEKKVKKRRAHRKKAQEPLPPPVVLGLGKVPPIVIQYSEPASLGPPPPPPTTAPAPASAAPPAFSTMFAAPVKSSLKTPEVLGSSIRGFITPSPASTISSVTDWIEPVPLKAPIRKEISSKGSAFSPISSSSLSPISSASPPSLKELIGSRESSQTESQQVFKPSQSPPETRASLPSPESIQEFVGGAVMGPNVAERVAAIERKRTTGDKYEAARLVRQAQQLEEAKGSDVPLNLLLAGRYHNPGQPRRAAPTVEQRQRLEVAGKPYTPKKK